MSAEVSKAATSCGLIPAGADHIQDIARLHAKCIFQGFLSTLGTRFLRILYEAMRVHDGTSVQVYVIGGRVVGFTSATEDIGRMYKWILKHYALRLAWAAKHRMFRLSYLKRILETLIYPSTLALPGLPRAEQLSVAVDPKMQLFGLGPTLIQASLEFLRSRGVTQVRTTCAEGLSSNRLVRNMGFKLVHVKNHHGRRMNVYVAQIK